MEVTYKEKSYTLGKKDRNVEGEAPAVRVKMLNNETMVIGLMAPAVQVMVTLNDISKYSSALHEVITTTKKKVNDAVDFIDSNYSRIDMSLNLVADTIGVNASYLSNIFKKEKGCSLSKYLTQTRLEQAKKYLTEYPDKTLIEIAESIGYSDVYYFSKNFKKYYGISPSKYQEERKM